MSNASVTVTGFVASDPKLWYTRESRTAVVSLRVGTTPRRVDSNGEWRDGPSSFFTVNCWRRLAINVSASVRKGEPVIVRGRLKMRTWTENGKTRSVVEIEADAIGHDMTYGWSHYVKGAHPGLKGLIEGAGAPGGPGRDERSPEEGSLNEGGRSFEDGGSYEGGRSFEDASSYEGGRSFEDASSYEGPGAAQAAIADQEGDASPPADAADAAHAAEPEVEGPAEVPDGELAPEGVPF